MAKHHHAIDVGDLEPDPNLYPDPLTDDHALAAAVTCQFLGRVFYEGDTICYQDGVWVCTLGAWAPTGEAC
jgi:hypothetical protein